jgi:hypothetical protein
MVQKKKNFFSTDFALLLLGPLGLIPWTITREGREPLLPATVRRHPPLLKTLSPNQGPSRRESSCPRPIPNLVPQGKKISETLTCNFYLHSCPFKRKYNPSLTFYLKCGLRDAAHVFTHSRADYKIMLSYYLSNVGYASEEETPISSVKSIYLWL